jgi:hypothetical protein
LVLSLPHLNGGGGVDRLNTNPASVTSTPGVPRVRNLLNRDYSQSIGFPAPPANFLAGFRYGF